jgi:epoxyqueuosine reductase
MDKAAEMTVRVKEYALGLGVDLVGIADLEKIPKYYPPRSPQDVMPGAKYAVVYAQKMLWGSIENPNLRIATMHTTAMYDNFYHLSQQIGAWLESYGYRAAVFNHYLPLEMSKERKGMSGDLSLKHLAIAAGLGTMGKSRLVLTKKYGPRVRFAAVLTDGEVVPDHQVNAGMELCEKCHECVKSCPVQAIKEDGTVEVFTCLPKSRLFGLLHFKRYVKEILDDGFFEKSA